MAKINLLPLEYRLKPPAIKKYGIIAAGIMLFGLLAGGYLSFLGTITDLQQERDRYIQDKAGLAAQGAAVTQLENAISKQKELTALVQGDRLLWSQFFTFVTNNIPKGLWVSEVRWQDGSSASTNGAVKPAPSTQPSTQAKGATPGQTANPASPAASKTPTTPGTTAANPQGQQQPSVISDDSSFTVPAQYADRQLLVLRGAGTNAKAAGQFAAQLGTFPYFDYVGLVGAEEYFVNGRGVTVFEIYCVLPKGGK